ncbi:MAG: hypothetical protein ACK5L5_05560 [Bacteroidales bacterium]
MLYKLFFIMLIPLTTSAQMKEIMRYGVLAPSSHNAQMWRVTQLDNSSFEVSLEAERLLPEVDPQSREAWISIGAFVENCVLAADDLGFQAEVLFQNQAVKVCLHQNTGTEITNKNRQLIEKRQTIRTPFLSKPIADSIITELCSSPQVQYHSLHSLQGESIQKLSLTAYEQQAYNTAKTEELGKWMSFSAKEEHEKKLGLTPPMMGMSRVEHIFFNLFLNKRSVSKKSFAKASVSKAKKQLEACSGYLLITSPQGDWESWFNSGRLLERVWLKGTAYELAVHPMSQVLEETRYYTLLKSELNISSEIQMILRVGKVKVLPERKKQRLEAGP